MSRSIEATKRWTWGMMVMLAWARPTVAQQCHWVEGFSPQGMNDAVFALTVYNDGYNNALYAAGANFTIAGGVPANYIAKWDGIRWTAVGSGMNSAVRSLMVFNPDSALYAGGDFTMAGGVPANRIAKWDGTQQWSALGSGIGTSVVSLAAFDDGHGTAPYAAAGSAILKYDGVQWGTVGGVINGPVSALTVFNDGSGPALYAGGRFTLAGGRQSSLIAEWYCTP